MDKEKEETPFFRRKLSWLFVGLLLMTIIVGIVIFPKQEKIIFTEYTQTHSLTRYYTEKDYDRSSQLIEAIRVRDLSRVKKMLATNMEVNCPSREGSGVISVGAKKFTALPINKACEVGDYKIVKALIESGAVVTNELLEITVSEFHVYDIAILQLLVKHGADASQEGLALKTAAMGITMGIDLAWTLEIFKFLEAKGMNIDEVDENKTNVVMMAAYADNPRLLAYLIEEKGMDINYSNLSSTVLIWATTYGNIKSVKYLVKHGADQTKKNSDGLTALEVAQKHDREEIVQILSRSE